jgi:putative beta-lysine N-acetyltransferase
MEAAHPCCSQGYAIEKIVETDNEGNFVEILNDSANERLKVIDYEVRDWNKLTSYLDEAADRNNSSKILFYIRQRDDYPLVNFGYVREGVIPAFFRGEDALCYSRFTDFARTKSPNYMQEELLLKDIIKEKHREKTIELPAGYVACKIGKKHVDDLVQMYGKIFSSYPSPLLNPEHVHKVMQTHVTFYGVFAGGSLVSAASAEMDEQNRNAEITDCATLSEHRGKGLLRNIIRLLEKEMWEQKIGTLYSLARAGSYGMNAALYRLGYEYMGRFINNCHIGGRYEDMNLWAKKHYNN